MYIKVENSLPDLPLKIKRNSVYFMEIKNIPIGEIKPASYNPRFITESEFSGLKESIKKFGMVDPLIVNTRTGILVGGHQRLKALEELNWKTVPVVHVDLSDVEEKALNVALNSHSISGNYDLEILPTLLDEIKINLPELNINLEQMEKDLGIFSVNSPGDRTESEQGLTPEEKKDIFDSATIKQIILYLESTEYEKVLGQLDNLMNMNELDSNTDAILYLLDLYESNQLQKTDNRLQETQENQTV